MQIGSTTHYFIEKVGMRIKEEGINVMGIPTSFQSLLIAKQWNIPVTTLEEHDIDLSVDGADEVDPEFNLTATWPRYSCAGYGA